MQDECVRFRYADQLIASLATYELIGYGMDT